MAITYAVDGCRDDQGALRDALQRISEEGGRVVSVTWQPERGNQNAGYTIVSEHERSNA
jgi:hypothetical protein